MSLGVATSSGSIARRLTTESRVAFLSTQRSVVEEFSIRLRVQGRRIRISSIEPRLVAVRGLQWESRCRKRCIARCPVAAGMLISKRLIPEALTSASGAWSKRLAAGELSPILARKLSRELSGWENASAKLSVDDAVRCLRAPSVVRNSVRTEGESPLFVRLHFPAPLFDDVVVIRRLSNLKCASRVAEDVALTRPAGWA